MEENKREMPDEALAPEPTAEPVVMEPSAEELPADEPARSEAHPAAEEPADSAAEKTADPAAEEPADPAAEEPADPAAEEPADSAAEEPADSAAEKNAAGEKEEQIVPGQGINTDKFDVSEPWLDGKRVDESVKGLEIAYTLRGDEVREALKYFQKKTIYRKNAIFTVILAVVAVFYAQAIFTDPSYTLGYIMLVLALAVIWFLWFMPARHIKSASEAADLNGEEPYRIEICPQGLLMPKDNARYLVGFDRPAVRAAELPDMYLIIASREKLFALPKRCIPPAHQQELERMLREALGPRYERVENRQ